MENNFNVIGSHLVEDWKQVSHFQEQNIDIWKQNWKFKVYILSPENTFETNRDRATDSKIYLSCSELKR